MHSCRLMSAQNPEQPRRTDTQLQWRVAFLSSKLQTPTAFFSVSHWYRGHGAGSMCNSLSIIYVSRNVLLVSFVSLWSPVELIVLEPLKNGERVARDGREQSLPPCMPLLIVSLSL